MKKLSGIFILILILIVAVVPNVAVAAPAQSADSQSIIHFINPTAVAVSGNNLFVADNIENDKTAILCFSVEDSAQDLVYKYTVELDGRTVNLAAKDDGLYALTTDGIIEFEIPQGEQIREKQRFAAATYGSAQPVDFAYGAYNNNKSEYLLTDQSGNEFLKNIGGRNAPKFDRAWELRGSSKQPLGLVAIDNYIYFLYESDNKTVCQRYNGTTQSVDSGVFNDTLNLTTRYTGLFDWNGNVALFSKNSIVFVEVNAQECTLASMLTYENDDGAAIKDVATKDDVLYVLNDKNQLDVFTGSPQNYTLAATIGSDTVDLAVPTGFTSFTLARPNGYPTNIVYKTVGDNSVTDIITDAQEYIILGYDGAQNCNYYYVLVDNSRFGWVKKSDYAASVEQDQRITIIPTEVTPGVGVEYKTKFTSLNAVYIYELPSESFNYKPFEQSADNKTEVTILQRFEEKHETGTQVWYYVMYGGNRYGFVKDSAVGYFYLQQTDAEMTAIGPMKINATLFAAVKVYATPQLSDDALAYSPEGNVIKLYSGEIVNCVQVLTNDAGLEVALIQINYGDGTVAFGYVPMERLIDQNRVTTNLTVGLSLLAVAIAIAVILVTVFLKRRKKGKKSSGARK